MDIRENSIILLSTVIWIYRYTSVFKIELVPDDINFEVEISIKGYHKWVIQIYENFHAISISMICIWKYCPTIKVNAFDGFEKINSFQRWIFDFNDEIYDSKCEGDIMLVATFFATCLQFCVPRVNRNLQVIKIIIIPIFLFIFEHR